MSATNGTPPIEYPRLTIGGVEYSLKFGLGSMYRLEGMGVEANALRAGGGIQLVCKMLAAALGSEVDGKWRPARIEPEELADMIPEGQLAEITGKINAAMGKAPQAIETAATPAEQS